MTVVQQVNISCECYHRRGLLYVLRPWAWGRPCRRCRRMMDRNVVVVPTSGAAAVTVNGGIDRTCVSPVVVSTTTRAVNVPQVAVAPAQMAIDWQATQQTFPSALPPKYSEMVATN
ncbi:uncharacterized protein [Drosophila virilis]|uniref:Uncharacterized protein n=1 Tax=Drosophila virilis TaxID=7244 RepID=A0A0Q9WKG6_DROVI|nr:uncharacterized protein LOC26530374 [Drosophila virilis]KRF81406.1 uncharacterized protein Dvir_GJ25604 [Drosophila virilis]